MFTIRKLQLSDFDKVMQLISAHSSYMGQPKSASHEIWNLIRPQDQKTPHFDAFIAKQMQQYYLNEASHMLELFGCFDQERLLSTMGIRKLESQPAWALTRLFAQPDLNFLNAGLPQLYDYCLSYCESLGLGEYFTCTPQKMVHVHERIWSQSVPGRKRYEIFTEDIIAPHTFSPYTDYQWLTGVSPMPIVLRKHILKEPFRAQLLLARKQTWTQEIQRWNPHAILESTH